MKNVFLLILATIFIGITSNAQNTLFPNYQAQGSPTTLNDFRGGLRTIKGLVNGRYFDTTAANNDPYIRAYAGAQIYTTKDSSIWIRNNPATRWMLDLNQHSDIITNIYNSSVISVTNLNDSTVIICYGDGTCDTINTTGSTITNINNTYFIGDSLLVICDTTQFICVGDSCYTTTLCDTITIDRRRLFMFQNGVRQLGTSLLVEHGYVTDPLNINSGPFISWFKHPTTLNTFAFDYTITGFPVWKPIMEVFQQQTWGISSQIATFKSAGSGIDSSSDFLNKVRLNIGYFSNRYGSGPASDIDTGYLGQDIAYYIGTNGSTAGSYGWQFDDPYSKHSGIAFNTKDTLSSVVLTFYGGRPPLTYLDGPLGFDEILNDKKILTLDYNKDARWFGYPNTRDDGANPQVGYGLYVDVDGYMKYGFIGGGGGGGGTDNFNLGAGFRLVVPSSQGVKTLIGAGSITIDSTSNSNALTITGTGITGITADNGLTENVDNNIQLGATTNSASPLLHDTYINTDAYILNVSNISTGVTANKKVFQVLNAGATFDATAGNITSFLGYFANTSTRSAGANNLTNTAIYATATGGQVNYAAYFDGSVLADVSASTSSTVRISGSASHSTIFTVQDLSANSLFRVAGSGQLFAENYGVGTFSGTPTFSLQVDANGNIIEGAVGISGVTADNGLTEDVPNNIQLGGTLLKNTSINTTANYFLTVTGAIVGSPVLDVVTTAGSAGIGLRTTGGTGKAILASTTGFENTIEANGTTGSAFFGSSTTGITGYFSATPATADNMVEIFRIQNIGSGSAGNGVGTFISSYSKTSNGTAQEQGKIGIKSTDVTFSTRTAQLEIHLTNNAVSAKKASIAGSGQWTWDTYGSGTHTGTTAKYLATTSSGAIIEVDPSVLSAVNIYNSDGTTTGVRTVTLGSNLIVWNGTQASSSAYAFNVSNTGNGGAIGATVTGVGNAISGGGATGSGVSGSATSGTGIVGTATTGFGGAFRTSIAATNTETGIVRAIKGTDGTAQPGLGGYFSLQIEDAASNDNEAARIGWVWTSATDGAETADLKFSTINSGTLAEKMRILGNGQLKLNLYGVNTFAGTPAYSLGVDATGNVVEFTGGAGSTAISALTAATADNDINNLDYNQTWRWNSLTEAAALKLATNSTGGSTEHFMLDIEMIGTHSNSSMYSSGLRIRNQHEGDSRHSVGAEIQVGAGSNANATVHGIMVTTNGIADVNTAAVFSATSATANYAVVVPANQGLSGFGTITPSTVLHVVGASGFRYVDGNQGANKILVSDANGVGTWTTPTFSTNNSGSQYQMGYYATAGTAISGNSGIVTNANNGLYITSSDDAPFKVTATGTGIAGQYFQLGKFLASNIGSGDIAQYFVGKQESSNDAYSIDYVHSADGSTSNYMGLGFYANNDKVKIYASGNVGIGLAGAPGERLVVSGNIQTNTGYLKLNDMTAPGTAESNYINIYMNSDKTFSITDGGVVNRLENAFNPLTTNTTTVGNVGIGEDDLMTYSVPAGKLAADGDYIEFEMTFSFAANANAKQVKVYFGATQLYASGSQTQNGGNMVIRGKITRTGATSQRISVTAVNNTTNFVDESGYVTASETLSGALTIKGTGEAVSDDDITQVTNIVSYIRLN